MLAVLAAICAARLAAEPIARPGAKAPNVTLRTLDGKTVALRSLRGKVVLLDFWATWCGTCWSAIPTLNAFQAKYAKQDFTVIGVSVDDAQTVATVPTFTRSHVVTYPIAVAANGNAPVVRSFGVKSFPTMILIDKRGVIRWSEDDFDPTHADLLRKLIEKLTRQ